MEVTNTRTLSQLLAVLAAAEMTCPGQPDGHSGDSPCRCAGTGRVPRFRTANGRALFRVVCRQQHYRHEQYGALSATTTVTCSEVGCPGWLPLPKSDLHLEALVEAAHTISWDVAHAVSMAYISDGMLGATRVVEAAMEADHDQP